MELGKKIKGLAAAGALLATGLVGGAASPADASAWCTYSNTRHWSAGYFHSNDGMPYVYGGTIRQKWKKDNVRSAWYYTTVTCSYY